MKATSLLTAISAIFIANSLIAQNVGIGTATPTEKIHVQGGARITSLSGVGNRLVQSNATGVLSNFAAGGNGSVLTTVAGVPTWLDPQADNGLYYNTVVDRIRLGGSLVEATMITSAGNPMNFLMNGAANFTVNLSSTGDFIVQDNGTPRFEVLDNGRNEMSLNNDATGAANTGTLEIGNTLRIDGDEIITNTNTNLYLQNDNNGDLIVDATTFIVDASTNRVGVGLLTPSRKLHSLDLSTINTDQGAVYGDLSISLQWGYGTEGYGGYGGSYGAHDPTMRLAGGAFHIGAYGNCNAAGNNIGISLGTRGDASGGQNAYGIYGQGFGATATNYAGYFNGNVFTTGMYLPSDERIKKNIEDLARGSKALDKIMALNPKTYFFDKSGFTGLIALPEERSYGFLAQEFEQIFPELTKQVNLIAMSEDGKSNTNDEYYTTINYVGLVPILTQGMQEQQEIIMDQNARIEKLEQELQEIKNMLLEK